MAFTSAAYGANASTVSDRLNSRAGVVLQALFKGMQFSQSRCWLLGHECNSVCMGLIWGLRCFWTGSGSADEFLKQYWVLWRGVAFSELLLVIICYLCCHITLVIMTSCHAHVTCMKNHPLIVTLQPSTIEKQATCTCSNVTLARLGVDPACGTIHSWQLALVTSGGDAHTHAVYCLHCRTYFILSHDHAAEACAQHPAFYVSYVPPQVEPYRLYGVTRVLYSTCVVQIVHNMQLHLQVTNSTRGIGCCDQREDRGCRTVFQKRTCSCCNTGPF